MNRFILTEEKKASLELQHLQCKDKKKSFRLKALVLLSRVRTVPKISQTLKVHQTIIIHHINEYHDRKLQSESGGSERKLNESQTEDLIAHLEGHTFYHAHEIILFIKDPWNINFSILGMNKWLHRHKFNYKKPKGFSYKANSKLQEEFMAEYEKLKDDVGIEEPILFMDTVHLTRAKKISYNWIRTGQTKHVETTGSRTRLNIVGMIQQGNIIEAMTAQYETNNDESIINFMGKLRGQYDSKTVPLILDR